MSAPPIRVMLADDHDVVRSALRLLLEGQADLEVVAEASDIDSANRYVRGHRPAVLVLDLGMPGGSALETIPTVRRDSPDTQIVVLTARREPELARKAIAAGALGYVLKDAGQADLLEAIRNAAAGLPFLDRRLNALLEGKPLASAPDGLSGRELGVLELIALGHTNAEIAQHLYLSIRTVESHRAHIQRKLQLFTRAELVRYASERGLVGAG